MTGDRLVHRDTPVSYKLQEQPSGVPIMLRLARETYDYDADGNVLGVEMIFMKAPPRYEGDDK